MVDLLIDRRFDPERIFAIYNGLDFTPRTPSMDRATFFRSVGLDADDTCVVAGIAARLNPVKDIATLIRGFARAHAEYPPLRLLIAGDGEEMESLKKLAADLGVAKEVCFAGWVSDTDSFYHALDINTLTSISETFPYVLTEGARAGLPTISSKVGGVSYLIDHGANGFLFPPGMTVRWPTTAPPGPGPSLRKAMGHKLYEKAKREFSIEATIQRQMEIYETILRYEKNGRDQVVICGAYGRGNAGDDAILLAILRELRSINPDLSCQVFSRNPIDTRRTYRVNAFYTFNFWKAVHCFKQAKFFINGGGSLMQDVTSYRSPLVLSLDPGGRQTSRLPGDHVWLRHRPHLQQAQPRADDKSHEPLRGCHHPAGSRLHEGAGGSGGHQAKNCPLRRHHRQPAPCP